MANFDVIKKIDLSFLGDLWKENKCYIDFSAFTIRDLQDSFPKISAVAEGDSQSNMEITIALLQDHFKGGLGISDGKPVKIEKEDLIDLPAEVINHIFSFLSESLVKKNKTQ